MNAHLYIGKQDSDEMWDCSSIMTQASWYTSIVTGQAGKLNFTLVEDSTACSPDFGNQVRLDVSGKTLFIGYIFGISEPSQSGTRGYLAYDQTRYLKNPAYYVFKNRTGSDIFRAVCADNGIKTGVIQECAFAREVHICDGKSGWEFLSECIDDELTSKGNYFTFYDAVGKMTWVTLNSLRTDIMIGEESLLQDYTLSRSIDEDTFNNIIVHQENVEKIKVAGKKKKVKKTTTVDKVVSEITATDIKEAKDNKTSVITKIMPSSFPKWGKLSMIETTQNLSEAEMKERGAMIFYLKNRPIVKLPLKCIGDINLRAGNGIYVSLPKKNVKGDYVILSCTHNIVDDLHTMDLEIDSSGVYSGL